MTFRRTILGDFAPLRELHAEIIAAAKERGLTGDRLFEIQLQIEESLVDAIKRFKSGAVLLVEAELDDSGLSMSIREAGR